MNLASPATDLLRVNPPLINSLVGEPAEPFFLKNSLNPMMIPFLESGGGKRQEAKMLVEVTAVTDKLRGAREGTEIDQV